MGFSVEEVQEILKSPINKKWIDSSIDYEGRVRFHSVWLEVDNFLNNYGRKLLCDKIRLELDPAKADIAIGMISNPVITRRLVERVKKQLFKVFDSKNQLIDVKMTDPEREVEVESFLKKVKGDFVKNELFNFYFENPCTILVVDAPREEGEPYIVPVKVNNLYTISYIAEEINFICYFEDDIYYFYDDESYYVFLRVDGEFVFVSQTLHNLGKCPASHISSKIDDDNLILRWSPLTEMLTELEYMVKYDVYHKQSEAYIPFPITSKYENTCDYRTESEHCDNGYLKTKEGYSMFYEGSPKRCPQCTERNLMGPGSVQIVPSPTTSEESDLIDSPKIIDYSIDGIKYVSERMVEIHQEIFQGITGKSGITGSRESINELQIRESLEAQKTSLKNFKRHIERALNNTCSILLELAFRDQFISVNHNLGTEFFILTEGELTELFINAKEAGMSEDFISELYLGLIESKYKDDADKSEELKILFHLNPWPHKGVKEVMEMDNIYVMDQDEVDLKLNYTSRTNRLKSEVNLVDFGNQLPFDTKIRLLKDILFTYGRESRNDNGYRRGNANTEEISQSSVA